LKKGLLQDDGCGACETEGYEEADSTEDDYLYCRTVDIVSDPYGLRVKVFYNQTQVAVYPTSGDFPSQGHTLISTGQLVNDTGEVTVSRTVKVYRSTSYLPGYFDYGVYTNQSF